jgi:hypothetical protein
VHYFSIELLVLCSSLLAISNAHWSHSSFVGSALHACALLCLLFDFV